MGGGRQLERLGAEIITDVPMPNTRHGIPAYFVISRVEAASICTAMMGQDGHRTAEPSMICEACTNVRGRGFGSQPKLAF